MIQKKSYLIEVCLGLCIALCSGVLYGQTCDEISLEGITDPGIHEVGIITEADGLRNGPGYSGATVYYPTDATPPFSSIVIVPGFVSLEFQIQEWGPFLASHGIVTMTIGTNSLFDDPYARRDALLDAIVSLKQENIRPASPLLGNLDTDLVAVGGWSMGGGGAQLAAASDPSLKAVVALCPWLDPQTTAADINHAVPVLIFSAELDAVAPHAQHADVHYENTPETTNKLIFEVENEGHSVANSPTGGQDYVGKIALSWLKQQMLGDSCYCPLLLDAPVVASNYMTNISCSPITNLINEMISESKSSFQLYPNPCLEKIQIEVQEVSSKMNYEIHTISGTVIRKGQIVSGVTDINTENLAPGIYTMNVITDQSAERLKFIVL